MRKELVIFSLFCFGHLMAQDMEAIIKGEREAFHAKKNIKFKRSGQQYDLTYQQLNLTIDPGVRYINGSVYSELTTQESNFTQFSFDLDSRMTVDSVHFRGSPITFIHNNDEVTLVVPPQDENNVIDVEIFYQGDPSINEQNGFSFDYQQSGPISWTLSEPYGAYGWWPCKQQLYDKIDSLDMNITIPKNNKAAGMGNLIKVDTLLPDSSLVYHWQHRYPITTYLVAVAVTNYYEESHFIRLSDGDSIFHLDYIYPSYKPQADTLRLAIDGMMRGFDSLFGDYPFRDEKYGHAMFGRGGGMEHQTMSFMSRLDFDLMAHELAHQWFGNKITCGSWQDLWLNEGWATYSNAIALELIKSKKEHHDFLIKSIGRATRNNGGSVFAYDTTNVNELFNGDMRYRKGAMVLHQLRWEIGDDAFFEATRNYLKNTDLCYGFAYTVDFLDEMEASSNTDLSPFFDRYVYKEGFPILSVEWKRINSKNINISLSQTTSHPSVEFFPLRIQFQAKWEGGDTIFTVDHNQSIENMVLDLGHKVEELIVDPNYWNLAKYTLFEGEHSDMSAVSIYPNPANQNLSVFVLDKKVDAVEIMDCLGRIISDYEVMQLKNSTINIDVSHLKSGTYCIRILSDGNYSTAKLIKD